MYVKKNPKTTAIEIRYVNVLLFFLNSIFVILNVKNKTKKKYQKGHQQACSRIKLLCIIIHIV